MSVSVAEALKKRISTRAFTDQAVTEDQVRALLDIARYSPSGGNLQPWKVIVVTGNAREEVSMLAMKTLAANPAGEADEVPVYPAKLQEPYRSRRYKVGEDMYALLGIERENKAGRIQWLTNNYRFFGAPVALFFVIDRAMGAGQWAHLGMFMQSLALAATEAGLATCMQEAWAMVRKSLHTHFQLGEEEMIYCGMALGYADEAASVNSLRTDRAEVAEFARFNGFA